MFGGYDRLKSLRLRLERDLEAGLIDESEYDETLYEETCEESDEGYFDYWDLREECY